MPEKGWYSLTSRRRPPRVSELPRAKVLTVDEFINELMTPASKVVWLTCGLCGADVFFYKLWTGKKF